MSKFVERLAHLNRSTADLLLECHDAIEDQICTGRIAMILKAPMNDEIMEAMKNKKALFPFLKRLPGKYNEVIAIQNRVYGGIQPVLSYGWADRDFGYSSEYFWSTAFDMRSKSTFMLGVGGKFPNKRKHDLRADEWELLTIIADMVPAAAEENRLLGFKL